MNNDKSDCPPPPANSLCSVPMPRQAAVPSSSSFPQIGFIPNDIFNLEWSEYSNNFSKGFGCLLENNDFVDVTLAAQGKYLQAHRIVLSVCSDFFKDLFKLNTCQHPIVLLTDINFELLCLLVHFMYSGQVQVCGDKLKDLLQVASILKIKGLSKEDKKDIPETPPNLNETFDKPDTLTQATSTTDISIEEEIDLPVGDSEQVYPTNSVDLKKKRKSSPVSHLPPIITKPKITVNRDLKEKSTYTKLSNKIPNSPERRVHLDKGISKKTNYVKGSSKLTVNKLLSTERKLNYEFCRKAFADNAQLKNDIFLEVSKENLEIANDEMKNIDGTNEAHHWSINSQTEDPGYRR